MYKEIKKTKLEVQITASGIQTAIEELKLNLKNYQQIAATLMQDYSVYQEFEELRKQLTNLQKQLNYLISESKKRENEEI